MVDACPVIEPVAEPIVWVAVLIRLHSFNVIVVFTCGNNNPGYGFLNYKQIPCVMSGYFICRELNLRKQTYSSSFAISDSLLALLLSRQGFLFVAEE